MNPKMLQQIQRMQLQMQQLQEEIAQTEVTGTAGGGMVTVVVTGGGEVRGITIDPAAVDPDDVEMLQDMVVAALNDAKRATEQLQAEKLGPLTQGLGGLGIPGL